MSRTDGGREQTNLRVKGWNVSNVLDAYRAKWPVFTRRLLGTGSFDLSPEASIAAQPDLAFHNSVMTYAYVLTLAARLRPAISVLDWGGGLGHYYLISRALIPGLDLDYHCREVPVLAEYGRWLLPQAHFYVDERCLQRTYDLVLASTSLHYAQDWRGTLERLASSTAGYMFVTGLPMVERAESFVFVNRGPIGTAMTPSTGAGV